MPAESTITSMIQFGGFLSTAKPGDRVVYHTGYLLDDRRPGGRKTAKAIDRARAIDLLADYIALAADAGLVQLMQRRPNVGGAADYLAVRTAQKGGVG